MSTYLIPVTDDEMQLKYRESFLRNMRAEVDAAIAGCDLDRMQELADIYRRFNCTANAADLERRIAYERGRMRYAS